MENININNIQNQEKLSISWESTPSVKKQKQIIHWTRHWRHALSIQRQLTTSDASINSIWWSCHTDVMIKNKSQLFNLLFSKVICFYRAYINTHLPYLCKFILGRTNSQIYWWRKQNQYHLKLTWVQMGATYMLAHGYRW